MGHDSDATYHDLIARNKRNSVLLVVGFIAFTGVLVGLLSAALVGGEPAAAAPVGLFAMGVAGVVAVWSYYGGGPAILRMSGAERIAKNDDPQLYNVVEELAIGAGVPVPPVYLIRDTAMNAFATGRDPEHAAVAITWGLRQKLSRDELQAVMAHEMSHVRHFDIRLMMLLATLVGIVRAGHRLLLADASFQILERRRRRPARLERWRRRDGSGVVRAGDRAVDLGSAGGAGAATSGVPAARVSCRRWRRGADAEPGSDDLGATPARRRRRGARGGEPSHGTPLCCTAHQEVREAVRAGCSQRIHPPKIASAVCSRSLLRR